MSNDFLAGVVIGVFGGAALIVGAIAVTMWLAEKLEKGERF